MADKKSYNHKIKLQDLREIIKIQCADGNWNSDPYMHGMANGLLMALSIVTDKRSELEPAFLEAPSVWLKDKPQNEQIVTINDQHITQDK